MLRFLLDPANAVTALALLLAVVGIEEALHQRYEIAVIAALWGDLADHFDGFVARMLHNRLPGAADIGKELDSLADIVGAAVFPSVLVLLLGKPAGFALVAACVLCLLAALRLSYFGTFGLTKEGRFVGVPVTVNVPAVAVLFAFRPWLAEDTFAVLLPGLAIVLAVLHVSPLRVPRTSGLLYVAIGAFVVAMTMVLAWRLFY